MGGFYLNNFYNSTLKIIIKDYRQDLIIIFSHKAIYVELLHSQWYYTSMSIFALISENIINLSVVKL